jgi:hypothetical protein
MFNLEMKLVEATRSRNLNDNLVLNGDEGDRTLNLMVANKALAAIVSGFPL